MAPLTTWYVRSHAKNPELIDPYQFLPNEDVPEEVPLTFEEARKLYEG